MADMQSRASQRTEKNEGVIAQIRAAASSIMERAKFARSAGKTFAGERDMYEALGYQRELGPEDYRERYDRNSIAGRVIDIFPDETWRGEGEVVEDPDADKVTAFEEGFNTLNEREPLWPLFKRADKLARLGEYSVILIGAPGKMDTPLGKFSLDKLAYLKVYGQEDVRVDDNDLDLNEESPRFGHPNFYRLTRVGGATSIEKRVHWSRIIHGAEGLLDDALFGTPALQRIWNDLDNLDKLTGGGSEAFWMRANQGYVASIDPAVKVNPALVTDLKEQVEEFAHNMRRTIGQQGIKLEALGSDTANFDKNVASVIDIISAGTGIPQRLLVGSERGQLASSQDAKAWKDRISDRRVGYAAPVYVRPFLKRLIDAGALPEPKDGYVIRWPEIDNLSEDEQMSLAEKAASVNQKTKKTVVTVDEIRDRYLKLPPLEDVDPEAAAQNALVTEAPDVTTSDSQVNDDGENDDTDKPADTPRGPKTAAGRVVVSAKEKRVAKAFTDAVKAAQNAVDLKALEDALATQDFREANRLLSAALAVVGATLDETLPDLLLKALVSSGKVTAAQL